MEKLEDFIRLIIGILMTLAGICQISVSIDNHQFVGTLLFTLFTIGGIYFASDAAGDIAKRLKDNNE